MEITKISPQKRKGKFNVFIDGRYSLSLSEEDILKEKIKVGTEVGQEKLEALKFQSQLSLWFSKILNFLSYRPRSEREVKDKLRELSFKERGLEESAKTDLILAVFEKVKRLNLVDDAEFGSWYINGRRESKRPMGDHRIRTELIKKGLKRELIDRLLQGALGSAEELATRASAERLKTLKTPDSREFKRKLSSFLLSRGFEWEVVSRVIDTLTKRQYNEADLNND